MINKVHINFQIKSKDKEEFHKVLWLIMKSKKELKKNLSLKKIVAMRMNWKKWMVLIKIKS